MKQSKLRRIHVVIIGAVVCVIVGVGMFFVMIKPANEALKAEQDRYTQYKDTGTPENVARGKADLALALKEVANAQNNLDLYMRTKMPNLSFADRPGMQPGTGRATGMFDLWDEQNQILAPLVTRWITRHGNVYLASGVTVPTPPINPNDPSFEQDVIKLPLGKVKIRGTFQEIMNNIRSWRACNRLVDINAPSFTGSSPKLECEYDVTVYLMPRFKADRTKLLTIAGGGPAAVGAGAPMGAPAALPAAPPAVPPAKGGAG